MEDHDDIHTSIYCHHRHDQPSEFVPISEAMALLTLNSQLHVLCGAVSKSCDLNMPIIFISAVWSGQVPL